MEAISLADRSRSAPHATAPADGGARGLGARVRRHVPRGRTLPAQEWQRRHRAITALLWLQAVALGAFGSVRGYGVLHSLAEAGLPGRSRCSPPCPVAAASSAR